MKRTLNDTAQSKFYEIMEYLGEVKKMVKRVGFTETLELVNISLLSSL
jgi:hypothetical protein